MGKDNQKPVLSKGEGPSFEVTNPVGTSPVLLVCEHASNKIPASLANLGLDEDTANSHVSWDPGALAVAQSLSALLDATLISARFSRLVYDCNRPPEAEGAMPPKSEIYDIPGNHNLTAGERAARADALYHPFKNAVASAISVRKMQARPTVLVTIHSFTPVYYGESRDVELGILHDVDSTLADAMLEAKHFTSMDTRRNAPYGMEDGVTHTLEVHAIPDGLLNVMIEIRNDLLVDKDAPEKVAMELAKMLETALESLDHMPMEAKNA